jgi:hypothetical protein
MVAQLNLLDVVVVALSQNAVLSTLRILYVSVVYQLDREWCPLSLGMATFVITLLVMMMHM